MGATEVGFLVRCGLVFRSQSLFGVARLFNEFGDSPVVTQVDSAGELTSKSREIHDVESRAASRLLVFCCLTHDIDHEFNVVS
jgi:hypothetical protein